MFFFITLKPTQLDSRGKTQNGLQNRTIPKLAWQIPLPATTRSTTHHRGFKSSSFLSQTKPEEHYRSDPVRIQSTHTDGRVHSSISTHYIRSSSSLFSGVRPPYKWNPTTNTRPLGSKSRCGTLSQNGYGDTFYRS